VELDEAMAALAEPAVDPMQSRAWSSDANGWLSVPGFASSPSVATNTWQGIEEGTSIATKSLPTPGRDDDVSRLAPEVAPAKTTRLKKCDCSNRTVP
jgi:hypothetical protein